MSCWRKKNVILWFVIDSYKIFWNWFILAKINLTFWCCLPFLQLKLEKQSLVMKGLIQFYPVKFNIQRLLRVWIQPCLLHAKKLKQCGVEQQWLRYVVALKTVGTRWGIAELRPTSGATFCNITMSTTRPSGSKWWNTTTASQFSTVSQNNWQLWASFARLCNRIYLFKTTDMGPCFH